METVALAWATFAVVVVLISLFAWGVVAYYSDPHDRAFLPKLIVVLSLTTSLLAVLLLPVDIYTISNIDAQTVTERSKEVKELYYVLYGSIVAFAFGLIPFAYFFYEEDDDDSGICRRILGALKYTCGFFLVVIGLIVVGTFLKPRKDSNLDWVKKLLDDENEAEATISFTIACVTTAGLFPWIFYTACGMASLPIELLRPPPRRPDESDLSADLARCREKIRAIQSKYSLTGQKISKRDKIELDRQRKIERSLTLRSSMIEKKRSWSQIFWDMLLPFRFLLGIVGGTLSFLLIASTAMTTVDKALNSPCGLQCGFALDRPQLINPLDWVLIMLSKVFPVDFIILCSIVIFYFICTISGVIKLGVRFACFLLYKIKAQSTPPQALLLTCFINMFVILVMSLNLLTIAPQYATFGGQFEDNNPDKRCSLHSPRNAYCAMSEIATFYNRIVVTMPIFGVIFYFFNWAFLGSFALWFILALCSRKGRQYGELPSSDDDLM